MVENIEDGGSDQRSLYGAAWPVVAGREARADAAWTTDGEAFLRVEPIDALEVDRKALPPE